MNLRLIAFTVLAAIALFIVGQSISYESVQ